MTMITNDRLVRPARSTIALGALLAGVLAGVGCDSSKLETGYQYRRLGASDSQRRAYYAPEYSREAANAAQGAQQSDTANMAKRRPGSPY